MTTDQLEVNAQLNAMIVMGRLEELIEVLATLQRVNNAFIVAGFGSLLGSMDVPTMYLQAKARLEELKNEYSMP
jgi:hypothetical protein